MFSSLHEDTRRHLLERAHLRADNVSPYINSRYTGGSGFIKRQYENVYNENCGNAQP
jgi:hypothetical protein